ncbi:hypothetical protein PROPEN_02501 [Proteus penneri ATCC 35198]|nr:hypothetical protein PROPEN_02501 [Proteus penneri ATCC 35198]
MKANRQIRLFAKPEIAGSRRLGVVLAHADTIKHALDEATAGANAIIVNDAQK